MELLAITEQLIKLAANGSGVLLCPKPKKKQPLSEQAKAYLDTS